MNVRIILIVVAVVVAFFAGAYWQKTVTPAQQPMAEQAAPEGMPQGMPSQGMVPEIATGEASQVGISWDVPKGWTDRGASSMRLATYEAPAQGGDPGECAVFYFGPTQGGDVESNIDRWIGQFESHGKVTRGTKTYGGMPVKLVEVDGDYLAPSGPMMESSGTKKGWMLKGAIVEGPNGNVFFKFTGPKKVLEASSKDFDGMLASLRKSQ